MIADVLIALPHRVNTTAADQIGNISAIRWNDLVNIFGGTSNTTTGPPNWGMGLWYLMLQYPDALGPIAYVILFSMPFVMMWITHADVVPAAIVGIFLGLYVAYFVSGVYFMVGMIFVAVALTTVIWSLALRRG